jgi:hypothetical protein
MFFGGFGKGGFGKGGFGKGGSGKGVAHSPFIGAQAGANDLHIGPGHAVYPSANATVYRVFEYAVPVTSVATVPSAFPTTHGIPGIAGVPGHHGGHGFGKGVHGI